MENIIVCVIFGFVALIMIAIGISNFKSTKPVGFYSGVEPPSPEEITDIHAYNKKHGWMWVAYGIGFIICGILSFSTNSELLFTLISCVFAIGGVFLLMIGHTYLEKKYHTNTNTLR